MKHLIIGTAGHVDHGKTWLIKALTGIDPDRLQEEKQRGITIDLGFAHLEFPDGTQAGIVDVPGHEKFIRNMLAGAGGMDLAMLVVAADEGFMPQTREHLEILSLLGVTEGLVVLTKSDLVDEDWKQFMVKEVENQVKGSFLQGKPILFVSAKTGEGLEELKEELHRQLLQAPEKNRRIPWRLPVDRVFSAEGFGTVVTGTLLEGCLHAGDPVSIQPEGLEARVRSLQVHGQTVPSALAGQRVAVNVPGVKKNQLGRGSCLCRPDSLEPTRMIDCRLQNLKNSGRIIKNASNVHLYVGAGAYVAKVILLGPEQLEPGKNCYVQLRLTEPVAVKAGDRFVIRFFSPLETIGGGVILDAHPARHKHRGSAAIERLQILERGDDAAQLLQHLRDLGTALPDAETLETQPDQLRELVQRGKLQEPIPGRYLSLEAYEGLWSRAEEALQRYHRAHPLHAGMQQAELRQKLGGNLPIRAADGVLDLLTRQGSLQKIGDRYALQDFTVELTRKQRRLKQQLLAAYKEAGSRSRPMGEMLLALEPGERAEGRQVLESLVSDGSLVQLAPGLFCHREIWQDFCRLAARWFAEHETLTLGQFRDLLGTSRDYALLVLERFDSLNLTIREDLARKPGSNSFSQEKSEDSLDNSSFS